MGGVEHDHLRPPPGPAAGPDRRRPRVGGAHERHRTARQSAARDVLARGADTGEVDSSPAALLEDQPLAGVPVEQLRDRVLGLEDEAGGGERPFRQTRVEPHRRRERPPLRQDQRRQLLAKRVALVRAADLTASSAHEAIAPTTRSTSPRTERSGRPARVGGEIASGDHRDREVRPAGWSLDVIAAERHAPVRSGDPDGALGPLQEIECACARPGQPPSHQRRAARPRSSRRADCGHAARSLAGLRFRSNHAPASRETSSSAPGSSNRCVAPGTIASSEGAFNGAGPRG